MSSTPSLVPAPETGLRRNVPRHALAVPLDIIALRSGIPDSLPGRCTDISEAGLGAAVAGELAVNQQVVLELKLPHVALPLRARAIVRHHSPFHCGLQFVNLSVEQREMIRFSVYRDVARAPEKNLPETAAQNLEAPASATIRTHKRRLRIQIRRQHIYVLLAITLVLAACAWWYWEWSWSKLERSVSAATMPAPKSFVLFFAQAMGNTIRTFPPVQTRFRADL
jgi:PilZ domain